MAHLSTSWHCWIKRNASLKLLIKHYWANIFDWQITPLIEHLKLLCAMVIESRLSSNWVAAALRGKIWTAHVRGAGRRRWKRVASLGSALKPILQCFGAESSPVMPYNIYFSFHYSGRTIYPPLAVTPPLARSLTSRTRLASATAAATFLYLGSRGLLSGRQPSRVEKRGG